MTDNFEQTGPTRVQIHEEREGHARVWITRHGRTRDPRSGNYREARRSDIIGSLKVQVEGGWEADDELRQRLEAWTSVNAKTAWPSLEEAQADIERMAGRM